MTREEVIAAIKKITEELGHVPSLGELEKMARVGKDKIRRKFGRYQAALEACGLEPCGTGYKLTLKALFEDWMRLVRRLRKVPSVNEYEANGSYSAAPFKRQFGGWFHVPAGMARYAQEQNLEEEWKDELDIVARHLQPADGETRNRTSMPISTFKPMIRPDEPVYGPPMMDADLLMEPTNEQGVLFLFGAVAKKLGFAVIRVQAGFPDCEAYREVQPGRWQRVWIELEQESRNFLIHRHDPAKCHLIVCWEHNWPESPLEVLELKSAVKRLGMEEKF